jgi:hypothetical protein
MLFAVATVVQAAGGSATDVDLAATTAATWAGLLTREATAQLPAGAIGAHPAERTTEAFSAPRAVHRAALLTRVVAAQEAARPFGRTAGHHANRELVLKATIPRGAALVVAHSFGVTTARGIRGVIHPLGRTTGQRASTGIAR